MMSMNAVELLVVPMGDGTLDCGVAGVVCMIGQALLGSAAGGLGMPVKAVATLGTRLKLGIGQ